MCKREKSCSILEIKHKERESDAADGCLSLPDAGNYT